MEDLLFRPGPIIWVQDVIGPGHADIFRTLTQFGTTWGVVLVVGFALWLWGRRDAYALVAMVVLQAIVSFGLNQLLGVPRPDADGVIKHENIQVGSFPSGHVFLTTVLWGVLWIRNRVPAWFAATIVVTVAVSRMYLGVHYVSDVVAGAVLGLLLVLGWRPLWQRAEPHLAAWRPRTWFAIGLAGVVVAALGFVIGFYGDNPFKWHSAGLLLGGIPALLLERRYVGYAPALHDAGTRTLRVVLSLVVLIPIAWLDRTLADGTFVTSAILVAVGALWAWFIAPAWFARLDRARQGMPDIAERAKHAAAMAVAGVVGIVVALIIYGVAIEPRFHLDVERHAASLPDLPTGWEGRIIAAIGDFQTGMWWDNPGMVRRAVARAIEERPAAVLLLGDFVYRVGSSSAAEVETVRDALRPLAASGIPTFAVLGNHDWGMEKQDAQPDRGAGEAVKMMLDSLGIRILHNDAAPVPSPDGAAPLWIVGIGSHYLGEDHVDEALGAVPQDAPRIVFMHHPDSFERIPAGAAPVAVAGHTHGGQVSLPFTPHWSWMNLMRNDEVRVDGWIERDYGAPGNRLYVNRGIGMSVVPLRLGAAPELTLFSLTREHTLDR